MAPIKILVEYTDYISIFSSDLVIELPENVDINEHTIKLIKSSQSCYGSIYILSLIELENLKTYIKSHLKTGFIRPFQSLAGIFILFDKKSDDSFHLYINY